jgi:serine/threonine protein kinase
VSVGAISAAADLVGQTLDNGWRVVEKVQRKPGDTGGNFSINYWVENEDGRRGFCKVFNYEWVLTATRRGGNVVDAMSASVRAYQFERDLARRCIGMSRVITALDDGEVDIPGYLFPTVSYIIFEVADQDMRRLLNASDALDVPLRLAALHHLATGLRQLHRQRIAHQDVKPSNTLVFEATGTGNRVTKIGDLGRATIQGEPIDHDEFVIAGDPAYAPPEALYGEVMDGMGPRRFGCDLYQLGSMICFAFTGSSFNMLLKDQLHPQHSWSNWGQAYADVLPIVRDAFGRALDRLAQDVPEGIRERVVKLVEQLCEPDPLKRGDWKERKRTHGNQWSLDRVVTELDVIAKRSVMEMRNQ